MTSRTAGEGGIDILGDRRKVAGKVHCLGCTNPHEGTAGNEATEAHEREIDLMCASRDTDDTAVSAQPDGTEREAIAVFRVDGVVEGWIAKPAGRISDGLNDADRIQVGIAAADGTIGASLDFDLDDVVAVAPAPRPPSPARVSRRHHPVEVEAGPYRVKGIAHLPIGADPQRYVASTGRRWLPLTECTVSAAEDDWAVEVVIVNLDYATRRTVLLAAPKFG